MAKRISVLCALVLSVVVSVFIVVGVANASQQDAKTHEQESKNAVEIKTVDLGETGSGQCWQKFTYQFNLNEVENLSLNISDTNNQQIYFNLIKIDENNFKAGLSETAFEMSEKYSISNKTLSAIGQEALHFEIDYQNAKFWFRYWTGNEEKPVIATGGAIIDFETFCPRYIKASANTEITYTDSLPSKSAGKIIHFKEKQQHYYTDKLLLKEITYEQVKDKLPSLVAEDDPYYEELYSKAWQILIDNNIVNPPIPSPYSTYIGAGFDSKNKIWQWDSAFVLMFAKYSTGALNPMLSFDNFYNSQLGDGHIYRVYNTFDGSPHEWGKEPVDVNPPLYAYAELQYYKQSNDVDRLASISPALQEYADWLSISKWAQNSVHKLYWNNGEGSGMDNLPTQNGRTGNVEGVGTVDMSSQMVLMYKALAEIDSAIGNTEQATKNANMAKAISDNINKYCWCEADGSYYEVDKDAQHWKIDSIAGFWPLLAGICNEHQADALNSRLFDPNKFWTDIPFATLSKTHKDFSKQGYYWLGGVWAPTNYMVIKGLEKYGFVENSRLASQKYLDALVEVYKYTDTLWEAYAPMRMTNHYILNSYTGNKDQQHIPIVKDSSLLPEGGTSFSPSTDEGGDKLNNDGGSDLIVKDKFVGWTGTAPILLSVENIFGIQFNNPNKTINWNITRDDRHGIKNVNLPSEGNSSNSTNAGFISLVADKNENLAEGSRYINIESNLAHAYTLNLNIAGRPYQYTIPAGQYNEKVLFGEAIPQPNVTAQTEDTTSPLVLIFAILLIASTSTLIIRRRIKHI